MRTKIQKLILITMGSMLLACGGESSKTYENKIKASITVNDLSETITIDFQESPNGLYEYIWSVRFDANNDGFFGADDIAFIIQESKKSGEIERSVKIKNLDAWFVRYRENGSFSTTEPMNIEVSDNILSFVVDRDFHETLESITTMTQVFVKVYRSTPAVNSSDYIPENNAYTQEQDNSVIIDEISDYTGNSNISDITKFSLEIFE